ncbi:hypothetical protein FHS43_006168 [Streptosporangium becharense]|uniref:Uncharacterized protein n=1 Tax=Streptosporangium becharense TaxID=1816182 RepID=A0A7W9MHD1_9ACTN|nr:hypothetical protein [Streptosporangium becharense]MBB2914856.1 hypothetical protein [Streptosporangium becharense]MBB5820333.1 hypothetical protein [Streptosporangium becharense]
MPLDSRLLVQLAANLTNSLDLTTVSAPLSFARQLNLTDGAGAGQANRLWSDTRTVGPSATDSIDLAGSLTDPFGAALTFARIKAVLVAAALANVTEVRVTRPASNAVPLLSAAAYLPVKPGGVFLWFDPSAAGVPVTAGTGDLLDMVNSGATAATYDVVIIGAAS